MKIVFLLSVLGLALAGPQIKISSGEKVMPKEAIDYINSQQSKWTASDEWVADMTIEEAKRFANAEIRIREFPERNWGSLIEYTSVPTNFDSRQKWPNCIHPILNQGQCGSCWAFGATEALSDRLCIDSNGSVNEVLSPQYLVSCDYGSYGCDGGWPDQAWSFMRENGVATNKCVPYEARDGTCPSSCSDGSPIKLYHADSVNTYSGPSSIQMAILEGGPVETAFTVYQDFMSYKGGIYEHTYGKYLGGHAVKIIGWGYEQNTHYWLVANSWGTSWGLQGFFKIAFGQCGIDNQAVAGKARV